jgi:hypothetical protein
VCFFLFYLLVIPAMSSPPRTDGPAPKKRLLLALHGKIGSGKTTISRDLSSSVFRGALPFEPVSMSFATPIKQIVNILEGDSPDAAVDKSAVSAVAPGYTKGKLLQLIGTFLREIDPDIFVNSMRSRIENTTRPGTAVIIDDMRFKNEYEFVTKSGGLAAKIVWAGERPDNSGLVAGRDSSHVSETQLDDVEFEHVFENREPISNAMDISDRIYRLLSDSYCDGVVYEPNTKKSVQEES